MKVDLFECLALTLVTCMFSSFLVNYRRKDNVKANLDLSGIAKDYRHVLTTPWTEYSARVDRIASLEPSLNRNLQISHTYQELGFKLGHLIGTQGEHYENMWTMYAAWASNSVGDNLRLSSKDGPGDSFWQFWSPLLESLLPEAMFKSIRDFVDSSIQNCFIGLSMGNRLVFKEVASAYVKFGEHFGNATVKSEQRWKTFEQSITYDKSLNFTVLDAMHKYYLAMYEADTDVKVQLVLWANILLAYVEQLRLQEALTIAFPNNYTLESPVTGKWTFRPITWMTEWYLTVQYSKFEVRTGYNLPLRPSDNKYWPENLQRLTLKGLEELYQDFNKNLLSTVDSKATNWLIPSQRLRFLFPMLRAYQDDESFQCPLFTKDQAAHISKGGVLNHEDRCHLDYSCCEEYNRK